MSREHFKPITAFQSVTAARANGWTEWNRDADGVQWFKRGSIAPMIYGEQQADESTDEDDDTEGCQFYEIDAEGERVPIHGLEHLGRIRGVPAPIIQRADESFAETVDKATERYNAIVQQRAAGEDIDHEYGDAVLEMAGKTMDDFNADVAELRLLYMGIDEVVE